MKEHQHRFPPETPDAGLKPPLLIMIRHGQTDHNAQRRFQGHKDVPLNEEGRLQAARAAAYVAALCRPRPHGRALAVTHVLSSDLSRALESATILRDHLPQPVELGTSTLLRECDVGLCEGLTFSEFETLHPKLAADFLAESRSSPETTTWPNGESPQDVKSRALRVFAPLTRAQLSTDPNAPERFTQDSWHNIAIWEGLACEVWVSHGGLMRIFMDALGIQENFHIGNSHVVVLGNYGHSVRLLYHAAIS